MIHSFLCSSYNIQMINHQNTPCNFQQHPFSQRIPKSFKPCGTILKDTHISTHGEKILKAWFTNSYFNILQKNNISTVLRTLWLDWKRTEKYVMYFLAYIYYNMDILQKTHDFCTKSKELMAVTEKMFLFLE